MGNVHHVTPTKCDEAQRVSEQQSKTQQFVIEWVGKEMILSKSDENVILSNFIRNCFGDSAKIPKDIYALILSFIETVRYTHSLHFCTVLF